MKRTIFSLVTLVALIVMALPAVSPPSVAAGGATVDFTQYANEDDEWINSILNKNNSKYYECMSVAQRIILADIPPTAGDAHTFTFSHETTKGGIHAYDWLTAYDQGNEPPLAFNACGENLGNTPDYAAICQSLHSSGDSVAVDVPNDTFVSKDGLTQEKITAYELQFGNREITIYGNEPITGVNLTLSHSVSDGGDTGDSDIGYVLTWTSNSTQILIEMAGHLAVSGDPTANQIAWGIGLGASYVSGGPYHFKLGKLDGASLGSKDNPIKGADVLELVGTIVAHKFNDLNGNGVLDDSEADLEGWTMTLYEGSNCTGDILASGITDINGDVVFDGLEAGTYSVKETLEPGWINSTALCQQVNIEAGESVTLNFGNVELVPDIDVDKSADPSSGAESTNVTFTITVENTGDLTLDPVKVVDTIPAGMSYVSTGTSPAPDSSTENPDGTWNVTWNNIGSLTPGNTTTIYLIAHIDGDELGTLTNIVTATGTPTYGNDVEDTDTADVEAYHAGIRVEKTANPGCGGTSANVTFTIVVTNTNGSVLEPVIVVDTLPDGMSYVSDDSSGTVSGDTITWEIDSLASGNSTTIHLVASIDGDELGILINEVTATGTPPEGDDVEYSDTADVLAIDARISISPPEDINVVGDEHVLTAKVEVDDDGTGWDAYEGATVTFDVTSGPGDLDPVTDDTNASGEAHTTLTSTEAGTSEITASTSICGYDISTDGEGENGDPAEKEWVYARIKIDPPHDTNVVGDSHTFTATVETSTNNITWDPYEGATVTFDVTDGPGDLDPESALTDINGEAVTTLTSTEAGNTTVTASTTVYDWDLSTDGELNNSDPAEKEWVYARIKIDPPHDINVVGDSHTFTATVETSTNNITWDPYEGATVTFEVTDGPGTLDPESALTDVKGEAVTTLISTETGTTTVKASTTVYDHDLSTDGEGYSSYAAKKEWVDARISIFPDGVNPVGQPHDFTITVEKYPDEITGWIPAAGVNVTGTTTFGILTGSPAMTNSTGQVTFTVNSGVAGTAFVHASATVSICDIDIDVATNGYGAYDVSNTKRWTTSPTPPRGGVSCPTTKYLTVDWEGNNTTEPLYSNDKLVVDLFGPSLDLSHSLFLERSTHAPVVGGTTHYLIIVRELEEIPDLPENLTAIVVFNITPADAVFNKDIFLTLGIEELPEDALNVTMAYYDDIDGVWETLEFEAGGPSGVAELTLSAPINHFSIYGVLAELETTPPQPAHFVASGLNIEPTVEKTVFVTRTGETVTITAHIENDGGQEGTHTVDLKLDGKTVDTQGVLLSAGFSDEVSFTLSGLDYGQHEVEVGGLSDEFTTSRTIAWWLIILIIVAVGLIIWGVVWGRRRRRAAQEG